jgi:hypothetical protein
MKRYLLLLDAVKTETFDFATAEKILTKVGDNKRMVGLFLSELRKAGWLKVELDKKDARKRVYALREYSIIFNNYVKSMKFQAK